MGAGQRELVNESPPREWEGFIFYYYPIMFSICTFS